MAVGVLFVGVLLFSGWQRVELLQHGYRVEQMQKERGDEEEINRHLRLEIETLKSPQRIETLATERSAARGAGDRRRDRHRARRARRNRRRRRSWQRRWSNRVSEPTSDNWRATIRSRLLVGAAIFMLWAVGIQARLLYLQVHKHDDLQARAENQSARTMDISAKRGDILDRHGRVLAYSVDADSVYGVPSEIEDAGEDGVACSATR